MAHAERTKIKQATSRRRLRPAHLVGRLWQAWMLSRRLQMKVLHQLLVQGNLLQSSIRVLLLGTSQQFIDGKPAGTQLTPSTYLLGRRALWQQRHLQHQPVLVASCPSIQSGSLVASQQNIWQPSCSQRLGLQAPRLDCVLQLVCRRAVAWCILQACQCGQVVPGGAWLQQLSPLLVNPLPLLQLLGPQGHRSLWKQCGFILLLVCPLSKRQVLRGLGGRLEGSSVEHTLRAVHEEQHHCIIRNSEMSRASI